MPRGYDGDNLRVWKSETGTGGATTYYLNDDDGSPIMELSASGAVQAMNGYGPTGWAARDYPGSGALAATYGAQDYSYTYDPEGNLVQRHPAISDGADALGTSVYDAYGNLIADDNATGVTEGRIDPVGFGGQYGYYFDAETGKSLLGHRYYDSAYGRFLNRDPIGYNGGINLYGYAGNNPITEADPSGDDPTNVHDNDVAQKLAAINAKAKKDEADWQVHWARLQYLTYHPDRFYLWSAGINNAADFCGDFLYGLGPSYRSYDPTSVESLQMLHSADGKEMLIQLAKLGYRRTAYDNIKTVPAAKYSFESDLALNATEDQVGAFDWKVVSRSKTSVCVELSNDATVNSLFYHLTPPWLNHERPGPMGTIHQYFFIDVPIPSKYQ